MMLRSTLAICLLLVSAAPARAQSASSWFLAEGASNALFTQEILVANPNAAALTVTITLLPQPGAVTSGATSKPFAMAPLSRRTVNLKVEFPNLNGAASAQVSAVVAGTSTPADIVVERSMYFPDATRAGGHNASGVTAAAERWILAEGASTIFNTFVLVTNPNAEPVEVRVTYLRGGGAPPVSFTESLAPNSRRTFWPQVEQPADLGSAEFSTIVESLTAGRLIVAERAMYFDYGPSQSGITFARSGHDALGVSAPSTTWYFAEGNTSGGGTIAFETFLLLANQNATATDVTVTYQLDSGVSVSRDYVVPARERFTVWVDQEGRLFAPQLRNAAFGISVLATQPIVAERAMYWGMPSASDPTTPTLPWAEGHATAGAPERAATWGFAEGAQDYVDASGTRYQTFLLYANPNPAPIAVRATFLREDGTGIQRDRCVPGNGRANVWTADFAELSNRRFAAFVQTIATAVVCPGVATTGGEQFVAERAMYWGQGFAGGHVNIGTPWTGTITAPPAPNFTLTATMVGPTSGRLSGGEWVTLNVQNVAPADIQVTFGGRPAAAVQFGPGFNQIRALTPIRTQATGYGSAGPAPVQVQSLGRTANAGSFTFTFSVLVFGDSITWGTFNIFIPETGQKLGTQVNDPYPRVVKNLLNANPRFGSYTQVTNAGYPGERASGEGELRMPRCLATGRLDSCGYVEGIVPGDFTRPFDVVILFEGINDLIWGRTPQRARDALRTMVLSAKSYGARVIIGRFDSFKTNEETGYWTGLNESKQLAELTEALSIEQGLPRIRFDGISMSWDGLHPDQIGYDRMGQLAFEKILESFPP